MARDTSDKQRDPVQPLRSIERTNLLWLGRAEEPAANEAQAHPAGAPVAREGAVQPHVIGRYALFDEIASGGMGVVHFGRLLGSAGFERVVAIKRAHRSVAADHDFVAMFREEIRILSRVRHPNVAAALDVVEIGGELLLVMEYVHGLPLSTLTRLAREARAPIPIEVCVAIACAALSGLHAAHTAQTANGEPLDIVHRDVSPQNVLVACDGSTRVLDFGVAKAARSLAVTRAGNVKGKVGYIAPEHLLDKAIDCRADLYGVAVVLWEMLTLSRLFTGKNDVETVSKALVGKIPAIAKVAGRSVPKALEAIVRRGLATEPRLRFASAREMALALEAAAASATPEQVAEWVKRTAGDTLVAQTRKLAWAENCPVTRGESSDTPRFTVQAATESWDDVTEHDPRFEKDELPMTAVAAHRRRKTRPFSPLLLASALVAGCVLVFTLLFAPELFASVSGDPRPGAPTPRAVPSESPAQAPADTATTAPQPRALISAPARAKGADLPVGRPLVTSRAPLAHKSKERPIQPAQRRLSASSPSRARRQPLGVDGF